MSTPSLLNIPYRLKAGTLYSQIPETGLGDFAVTRATSPTNNLSTRVNSLGFIERVNDNVPRLDYPLGGAVNGCPALLVEPAATNLLFRSEEFDNAYWGKVAGGVASAPVVTLNAEISPDGTMNADRVVFNLNGGVLAADISSLESASITHAAAAHAQSVYARTTDGTNKAFTFVTPSGSSALITITPTWQRFIVTGTLAATSNFRLRLRGTEGTASSATIALWGAQYEAGTVPTSYIPTTTAAITRAADVINKTGVSSLIGQTEGTIYAEVDLRNTSSGKRIFLLSDGTTQNEIRVTSSATNAGDLQFAVRLAGTLIVNAFSPTNVYSNGVFKIAAVYKSTDYALYVNGLQVLTSNAAGSIPACNRVDIGSQLGTSNFLNDRIRAAAAYPNRLSNTELIALTT
jgi:hypothetical protein